MQTDAPTVYDRVKRIERGLYLFNAACVVDEEAVQADREDLLRAAADHLELLQEDVAALLELPARILNRFAGLPPLPTFIPGGPPGPGAV